MQKKSRKDKKLEIILSAAEEEFASLPYDKVSVFKIAEKASISRASFYCYFKNKEEIYKFILEQIKTNFYNIYLINKKVEFFELIENLFEYFISFKNSSKHKLILKLFENLKPDEINYFTKGKNVLGLTDIVDTSTLKNQSSQTLQILFKSIFACMGLMILHFYKNLVDEKTLREVFKNYLNIIKFGAYKEKGE